MRATWNVLRLDRSKRGRIKKKKKVALVSNAVGTEGKEKIGLGQEGSHYITQEAQEISQHVGNCTPKSADREPDPEDSLSRTARSPACTFKR